MKKWIAAAGCVLVLVVAMVWLLQAPPDDTAAASRGATTAAAPAVPGVAGQATLTPASSAQELQHYAALGAKLGKLPASLTGTHVDGHVAADAQGKLIVDVGIKQMFDYFLSAMGEESLDNIKGRIALYLQQKLPAGAAQQAWTLLDHYLQYRQSLTSIAKPTDDSATSMRQVLAARDQLRTTWLGETASDAFFGPEEAYDNYTLSRMQIEQNKSLSAADKQAQLDALKANLPPQVSDMIQQTMAPADAATKVATMRAQGASEAQVQAYRESQFGTEAADRFKRLDEQRAAWQGRYDDYRKQRADIIAAKLAPEDQANQIDALRERLFDAGEQKRVAALDHIASQTTTVETAKGKE